MKDGASKIYKNKTNDSIKLYAKAAQKIINGEVRPVKIYSLTELVSRVLYV